MITMAQTRLEGIVTKLISDSGGDLVRFVDGAGYPDLKQWVMEIASGETPSRARIHGFP